MKNREVLTALGIATALSVTGCATTSNATTDQTQVTKQAEVDQQVDEATPTPTPVATETPTPTPEPERVLEDAEVETIFENAADEAKFEEAVEAGEAITAEEAEKEEVQDELAARIEELDKTMYAVSEVNLRAGDSTDYEKVGALAWAEEVHVTGRSTKTKWFRIERPDGTSAYVSNKYLSDNKPQAQKKATQTETQAATSGAVSQPAPSNTGGPSWAKHSRGRVTAVQQEEFQLCSDYAINGCPGITFH